MARHYTAYDLSAATEDAYDAASDLSGLYAQLSRLTADDVERRRWEAKVPEPLAAYRGLPCRDVEARHAAAERFRAQYRQLRTVYDTLVATRET